MAQCGCMDEKTPYSRKLWFQHYYQLLFLLIFISHTPPLRVLEVNINSIRGITIHITEFKINISYSKNLDSKLMLVFYYFYMSPLSNLTRIIAKGSTFSISSPFDVTKLQKTVLTSHRLAALRSQCQWTGIFKSPTTPMAMGTQLRFKLHRESLFISVFPKTIVSTLIISD